MLSKIAFRTQLAARRAMQPSLIRPAARCFADTSLVKTEDDGINLTTVATETKPLAFELENYGAESLKNYFDQEALLIPVEEIQKNVRQKNYSFFLGQPQFYKIVDTMEKYQSYNVDLDTQEGRDFYVFKRQLYQLYEIQNRSVEEHEAFSFQIERENLKWLFNANQDFNKEMMRVNVLEELRHHCKLGGLVFKRKPMDPVKLKGLGYFGAAGLSYFYYPYVAMHFGQTFTQFAMTAACLAGMNYIAQREPIVNTITFVKEGEHAGKVEINYQTTLLTSKTIVGNVQNVMAIASLDNDDMGEDDIESNILAVNDFVTPTGEVVDTQLILPADSYYDKTAMEWILSIKNEEDSTADDFNDLVASGFFKKQEMPKLNAMQLAQINAAYDRAGSNPVLDAHIEKDDQQVEHNLQLMREFYGEEQMAKMTPEEFYQNYKKFSTGLIF